MFNLIPNEDLYVIQSGYVGNAFLFWDKYGSGYTANLADAKIFKLEEALKIKRSCESSHDFKVHKLSDLNCKTIIQVDSVRELV